MKQYRVAHSPPALAFLLGLLIIPVALASPIAPKDDRKAHADRSDGEPSFERQLADLKAEVERLDATLSMGQGAVPPAGGAICHPIGAELGITTAGKRKEPGYTSKLGRAPHASMSLSMIPGSPGASRLYHIGSTGFFLNHTGHLALTAEQRKELNKLKLKAVQEQNDYDRRIERAEEELWSLTGADSPDIAIIDQKVHEIADLEVAHRLAFIRAVGLAAEFLTVEQRAFLTGSAQPFTEGVPKNKSN